jgi:phytoene dehydrogenase-like protein
MGMGGLAAAAALAPWFRKMVVLDRDVPGGAVPTAELKL